MSVAAGSAAFAYMRPTLVSLLSFGFVLFALASVSFAQSPAPKELPPLWDVQIGASFVGTSGNSDTTTGGGDFALRARDVLSRFHTFERLRRHRAEVAIRCDGTVAGGRVS